MKPVTISFSQDPDVCRTLFFSCYRRSISGFFRIVFLLCSCTVILGLLFMIGFLSSLKQNIHFFWSLLFLIAAALVLMVFCLIFFLLYPSIRFRAHLFAVNSLKRNGISLNSLSFLEDSLKLDLLLCHSSETKCIPYHQIKKCIIVSSGIAILFNKNLPLLLVPKTLFYSHDNFLAITKLLRRSM